MCTAVNLRLCSCDAHGDRNVPAGLRLWSDFRKVYLLCLD